MEIEKIKQKEQTKEQNKIYYEKVGIGIDLVDIFLLL